LPRSKCVGPPAGFRTELGVLRVLLEVSKTRRQIADETGMSYGDTVSVLKELSENSWIDRDESSWHAGPARRRLISEQRLKLTEGGMLRAKAVRDLSVFELLEKRAEGDLASRYVEGFVNALEKGWVRAAEALGRIGDPRGVKPLVMALKSDSEVMRAAAARALGEIGDSMAVEALIVALNDYYKIVRNDAALALGEIGDTRAIEPLVSQLRAEGHGSTAWFALSEIGAPAVAPLLRAYSEARKDRFRGWHVINEILRAFEQMKDPNAVDPLLEALKSVEYLLQARIASALGNIGDARAVESLIQLLKSGHSEVRWAAVSALERIGDSRALEPLTMILNDPDNDVRELAKRASDNIRTRVEKS